MLDIALCDLGARQHDWHVLRTLGAGDAVEPRQLDAEHLASEEQQRGQRLVLGGRADLAIHREAGEEGLDLGRAHLARMPAPVKAYESADPPDLGLLRAQTMVLEAQALAHYRDEG